MNIVYRKCKEVNMGCAIQPGILPMASIKSLSQSIDNAKAASIRWLLLLEENQTVTHTFAAIANVGRWLVANKAK